jgi:Flp pilus assembly protein TadD
VVNICIHIISSLFVYLVFLNTLILFRNKNDSADGISNQDIALLGTILWAIHPIQTQAITYIVQREASMAAMFYMIAMYCYIRFRQNYGALRQGLFLSLAFLFWIAGVLTKENTVMLPLVVLGYEIAFFRTSLLAKKKYFIILLAVFLAVSTTGFFFMRGEFFSYIEHLYAARPFTMWQRLITEPIILTRYLFLLLCPLSDFLSLESDIFASSSLISPLHTLPANLFILAISLFGIIFLKKWPIISFALFYFIVNHLVESSFLGLELYFEHRNYLPSMFIYFALSWYFVKLIMHYRMSRKPFMQAVFVTAMVCVLVSEGNATYLRNDFWRTEVELLTDTVEKAPKNIRPYISLGVKYKTMNQVDKAKEMYRQAEKLYKENPEIYQKNWVALLYYNAGVLAIAEKKNEKAIQLLYKSSEIDPLSWDTHVNLGYLYFKTNDIDNAQRAFVNAAELKPQKAEIYVMLGRALFAGGKYELALMALTRGIEVEKLRDLQLNLVGVYLATENQQKARAHFLRIPYKQDDIVYQLYRAVLYPGQERTDSLNNVAELLAGSRSDYCTWVENVEKNTSPTLIYPNEFNDIEPELRKLYKEKIAVVVGAMTKIQSKADSCGVVVSEGNGVAE